MDGRTVRRMVCLLWALIVVAAMLNVPAADATQPVGYYVLCDAATGGVAVAPKHERGDRIALAGLFPGARTAEIWIEENCPRRECDASGRCATETPPANVEGWLVLCNQRSGDVGLVNSAVPPGFLVMAGPYANQTEANDWVTGDCPSWRCEASGRCSGGAVSSPASTAAGAHLTTPGSGGAATGGWVAGRVQTSSAGARSKSSVEAQSGGGWVAGSVTTESRTTGEGGSAARPGAPPTSVVGPQRARLDLTPLVSAAAAAVSGCSFPTALANADQMALIEPDNPWLAANHNRLRQLSVRQKSTEQTVWRASAALQNGDLKGARAATMAAADTAVSCQSQAVSTLLMRIDETIAHNKAAKDQERRRAAGQLLAGLITLQQAVAAHEYGGSASTPAVGPGATGGSSVPPLGLGMPSGTDPCAFKYEYRNKWNTEPACTCPGYVFDPRQFRCVGGG